MNLAYKLLETPLVYRLWQAPFVAQKLAPVLAHLIPGGLLDVGCGPGTNADAFVGRDYLGVDINPSYIARAKERFKRDFIVADITTQDIPDIGRYDNVLCNSLLHHIDDAGVRKLLGSLAKTLRPDAVVHIVELVLPEQKGIPYLLAKADRGDHARTIAQWRPLLSEFFTLSTFEEFPLTYGGVRLWDLVYAKLTPH